MKWFNFGKKEKKVKEIENNIENNENLPIEQDIEFEEAEKVEENIDEFEEIEDNIVQGFTQNTVEKVAEEIPKVVSKVVSEVVVEEVPEVVSEEVVEEIVEEVPEVVVEKIVEEVPEVVSEEIVEEVPEEVVEEISEEILETAEEPIEEEPEKAPKKGFFAKMKEGLAKTRNSLIGSVENVLKTFTKIDEELFEELEETLIMADLGVETSMSIIESVRTRVKKEKTNEVSEIKDFIIDEITRILTEDVKPLELETPAVLLVIGVNGVGKTTTIGKLTNYYKEDGKKVILAAADTFRAAAIEQLEIWGNRSGVDVVKHQENSDPAAVVFDGVKAAKARNADLLICDTAGRLHNKKNLMAELGKIHKIISNEYDDDKKEVWLVLDATTGQNALIQAKTFKEVADITGIVLTKLDGTAKGGIIISIKNELKVPVRFIGVGEGIDDLRPFDPTDFAKALFGK